MEKGKRQISKKTQTTRYKLSPSQTYLLAKKFCATRSKGKRAVKYDETVKTKNFSRSFFSTRSAYMHKTGMSL
ncbi:hypothetical protein L917_07663 [Phytophthora nicotianae]|uniref:Uncharacterized protein n=1 Tax=Phytophthora nicotianae TaxID=4792 RepID=W2LCF8_PHYNI|nr:hypothetical protein L917_07663 [Phytophthora nicotianae]